MTTSVVTLPRPALLSNFTTNFKLNLTVLLYLLLVWDVRNKSRPESGFSTVVNFKLPESQRVLSLVFWPHAAAATLRAVRDAALAAIATRRV